MSVQYGSTYGTNTKYMRVDVTSFVNLCKTNPQTYSLKKGILLKNTYGEQSPEYSAMDSSVSITTTDTTATPSAACFSPYLMYTYEPYRIMLDAGHAAVSNPSGYHEGTRMWKLCQYLKSELQSLGYDVGVTRTSSTTDTPVAERGAMAQDTICFYRCIRTLLMIQPLIEWWLYMIYITKIKHQFLLIKLVTLCEIP